MRSMIKWLAASFFSALCLFSGTAVAFGQKPEVCIPASELEELGVAGDSATDSLFLKSVSMYAAGQLDSAYLGFKRLERLGLDSDALNYYLGLSEYDKRLFDDAGRHLERAWRADTTNIWYTHTLSRFYLSGGDAARAIPLIGKLVKKDPGSFANHYSLTLLGDWEVTKQRDTLALGYYDQALMYEPDYAPALFGRLDVFGMRGNYPAYFVALSDLMGRRTVTPDIKEKYVETLFRNINGQFYTTWHKQIAQAVDTCLLVQPDALGMREVRMQMCFLDGDTTGVVKQCAEIVKRADKDTSALVSALGVLGDISHSKGKRKDAYRYYEQALSLDSRCAVVLNNYAYFLCTETKRRKVLNKALGMSAIAIEVEPSNATYLDTYGWILYLLGRPEEAKPVFKKAMIHGGKQSAEILRHYSLILGSLGETDLASYYKGLSESR
ncbi:MAG: hypothetical protein MJY57_00260 [Bacteroidales bacterium]|nr:hypothetical protein [Bacteroidales bacterium]